MNETDAERVAEAPSYRVERVWDFLAVPEDRIDECLREFAIALRVARASMSLLNTLGRPDGVSFLPNAFTWMDDDKREMIVNIATAPPVQDL